MLLSYSVLELETKLITYNLVTFKISVLTLEYTLENWDLKSYFSLIELILFCPWYNQNIMS
jgi:hypothetical protein